MKKTVIFWFWVLGKAYGQSISTDRPDQTESANIVAKRAFQMETVTQWQDSVWFYGALTRMGISDRVELRFQALGQRRNWYENPFLGAKVLLMNETQIRPKIALIFHGHLAQNQAFTINKIKPNLRLATQKQWNTTWASSSNLGINYSPEIQKWQPLYTLSQTCTLSSKVSVFSEIYGSTKPKFNAGLMVLLSDLVQLDAALSKAYFTTGLSVLLVKK